MHDMDDDHDHYCIAAIASDGVVVQTTEVCADDLEHIDVGDMPKGSYATCIAIPDYIH